MFYTVSQKTLEIDKECFACDVSVDFRKAFDTVEQDILWKKHEHYGVRGL